MHEALMGAIDALPVHVRTAFYGAALKRGVIHRKSWDQCAFNAASGKSGEVANAHHFDIDSELVRNFIRAWDSSSFASDAEATEWLKNYLYESGLDQELLGKKESRIKKIVKITKYKNTELEKFNSEVESLLANFTDVDEDKSELQKTVEEAERVLELV